MENKTKYELALYLTPVSASFGLVLYIFIVKLFNLDSHTDFFSLFLGVSLIGIFAILPLSIYEFKYNSNQKESELK